jgi:hypothetical protein
MPKFLLTVTYDLTIPAPEFLDRAPEAAELIADVPGLVWKIWSLDRDSGQGASTYMFRDRASAETFAEGPMIDGLRQGPTNDVRLRLAPVEHDLSLRTHASLALAD